MKSVKFTDSLFHNIARCPALERVAHWSHVEKKKKTCQEEDQVRLFFFSYLPGIKGGGVQTRDGRLSHKNTKSFFRGCGGCGFRDASFPIIYTSDS